MAMVSARSSGVMCVSACWIGALGWGKCGLVRSRSRARSRERPPTRGHSAEFAAMGAIVSDRAAVSPMKNGLPERRRPADLRPAGRRTTVHVLRTQGRPA
jgi:hypothetical protein